MKNITILLLFIVLHFNNSLLYANPDNKIDKNSEQIVLNEDFEDDKIDNLSTKRVTSKESCKIVNDPIRENNKVIYFKLSNDDKMLSNGMRNELSIYDVGEIGSEYIYSFDCFIPDSWFKDKHYDILAQWHGQADKHLNEKARSPVLALRIKKRKFYITSQYDKNKLSVPENIPREKIAKYRYKKGVWNSFKFHVKWSLNDNGFIKVFHNNRIVAFKKGLNTYNDERGLYFKFGLYKPSWNKKDKSNPLEIKHREIFFDNVYIKHLK